MLQSQLVTLALARANFDEPNKRILHAGFAHAPTHPNTHGSTPAAASVGLHPHQFHWQWSMVGRTLDALHWALSRSGRRPLAPRR
jgi:hypothetical protein